MIAGILEIQMMANMVRLSDDMRKAEQVVSGSMDKVEKSIAHAKDMMQSLGIGFSIGIISDQLRRTIDSYTKLNAQLELSTKSQESYNMALADVRRISTVAQSDISATTMLYTRLMNVMDGTGVSQSKLATMTETISYGLKSYGASEAEAASASLQLSQAMGANRLGGEEFRAVMEAMPNVMKVLADSMRVPLGQLRQLSSDGKITAEEMLKAFGNPEIAAQFKKSAENTQTISGALTVMRNDLLLLVGEFAKSSGVMESSVAVIRGLGEVVKLLSDILPVLVTAFQAYVAIISGKFIVSMVEARLAVIAKTAAHKEELAMNVASAKAKELDAIETLKSSLATKENTISTFLSAQSNITLTSAIAAKAVAERASTVAQLESARQNAIIVGQSSLVTTITRELTAATALLVEAQTAELAITGKMIQVREGLVAADKAAVLAKKQLAIATEEVAAAEKLQAASSISIAGRIGMFMGKAGWIGLAIFGIWEVVDFLTGLDKIDKKSVEVSDSMIERAAKLEKDNKDAYEMRKKVYEGMRNMPLLSIAPPAPSDWEKYSDTNYKAPKPSKKQTNSIDFDLMNFEAYERAKKLKDAEKERELSNQYEVDRLNRKTAEEDIKRAAKHAEELKKLKEKEQNDVEELFNSAMKNAALKDELEVQSLESQSRIFREKSKIVDDEAILMMSSFETEKAIKKAQGDWSLSNEQEFQLRKRTIMTAAIEESYLLEQQAAGFTYAAKITEQEAKMAAFVGDAEAMAAQQALINEEKLLAETELSRKLTELEANRQKEIMQLIKDGATEKNTVDKDIAKFTNAVRNLDKLSAKEHAKSIIDTGMALTGEMAKQSRAAFEVNKALSLANATIKGYEAVMAAYTHGNLWGGPVGGAIEAGIALAFTAAQIAAISSQSFGGGSSTSSSGSGGSVPSSSAPAPTQTAIAPAPQAIAVTINIGDGPHSSREVRNLIEAINSEIRDGAIIESIRIS